VNTLSVRRADVFKKRSPKGPYESMCSFTDVDSVKPFFVHKTIERSDEKKEKDGQSHRKN
jgi:hypothetical protein